MESINFVAMIFLIELLVDLLVLKIFKIKIRFLFLVFLQLAKICASVVCVIYSEMIWLCILAKFMARLICIFFASDTFNFLKILAICFVEWIFLLAISGLVSFINLWIGDLVFNVLKVKIPLNLDYLIDFCIFLFIFAVFKIVRFIEKNKIFKQHLANVSLNLFGKHICFYGLIDSGNSLFDPKTNKPVILISLKALSKKISQEEIENLLKLQCRKIDCETISNKNFEIPIFDAGDVFVQKRAKREKVSCMIALIDVVFEGGKYECLLHRDYL